MKKLIGMLVITAMLASCNDTEPTTSTTDADSARAAAVADSISAANAMKADTMTHQVVDSIPKKVDSVGNK